MLIKNVSFQTSSTIPSAPPEVKEEHKVKWDRLPVLTNNGDFLSNTLLSLSFPTLLSTLYAGIKSAVEFDIVRPFPVLRNREINPKAAAILARSFPGNGYGRFKGAKDAIRPFPGNGYGRFKAAAGSAIKASETLDAIRPPLNLENSRIQLSVKFSNASWTFYALGFLTLALVIAGIAVSLFTAYKLEERKKLREQAKTEDTQGTLNYQKMRKYGETILTNREMQGLLNWDIHALSYPDFIQKHTTEVISFLDEENKDALKRKIFPTLCEEIKLILSKG